MGKAFLLSFLYVLIFTVQVLDAQNKKEELQRLADRHYDIRLSKMSEDGRWSTIRKLYDRNRDTILILDNHHPKKPAGQRAITGDHFFPDNNHLLTRNEESAELWDLKNQTGIYYEHVKNMNILKGKGLFVLHYNEKADNRVGVYDISGRLLQSVDRAIRFIISEDNRLYVITKEDNDKSKLFRLSDKDKEQLYCSSREIKLLDTYPGRQGVMIHEKAPGSMVMGVVYLDLNTKVAYPLQDVLPIAPQMVFTEPCEREHSYFLRVVVDYEEQDTSVVDIWYGNDDRLEKKFYPHPVYAYYLWKPSEKQIIQIDSAHSTEKISLGNGRYFLRFDRFLLQDYTTASPKLKFDIYDLQENTYSLMDTTRALYPSPGGEYILYPKNENWYAYHISSGTKKVIDGKGLRAPYFTVNGETVFWGGNDGWWEYNPVEDKLSMIDDFEGCEVTIVNGTSTGINTGIEFSRQTVNAGCPILFRLYNRKHNKTAYVLHKNGKNETIIPFTGMYIKGLKHNEDYTHFYYSEENYNLPPRLVYKEPGKDATVVFQSNKKDTAILSLKQETISYTNSDGIPLKSILYYPLDYKPSRRYPMVVRIYQIQNHKRNRYPLAEFSTGNRDGLNLRLLLEKGYFVYFPDIVYGEKGPGLSALDCVRHSLDALEGNPYIDKSRIGLFGFSHGGYETNFIATHSDRFATYVAGAGNSDIVRSYFSYNYNFTSPFYWQFETGQYEMKKSFSEDEQLYFQNNPIHYVDRVNAPILLWTGKKDQNIYWEQTMEFYIGLKRNRKKVVALFYPGEGHAFFSQEACNDLSLRILDWLDYYLKGKKCAEWIGQ